jgi:SAM-dependent methyltransferase
MTDKKNVLQQDDLKHVIDRYQSRIGPEGPTFESMKSGGPEKQDLRCKIHAESLLTPNPKILDIGSGIGYFYDYLKRNNIACDYTGYDVVPEYVAKSSAEYPEAKFYLRNVFEEGIEGMYDNIVLSQVLNNRYQSSDNIEVMTTMLEMAFAHTRVGVSIDMMSSYVDFQNEALYYYSPEQIFSIAKKIAHRVMLRHDYRGFEFCIQLYHLDAPGFVK